MLINVNKNCIKALKKEGPPVIIAAALKEAEAITYACRDVGINVVAFCDSEKRKISKKFCNLEIVHTPDLPNKFPKARIIIATQQVQDISEQLNGLGYYDLYSGLELIKNYDVTNHSHQISQEFMKTRLSVYKKSHEVFFDTDKLYMRSVDVMITERCSLKCKSCSNLMQYYIKPENSDGNKTIEAIEILNDNVDYISEFRVIGGEPLMNRNWDLIVKGIIDKNPERKVFIYTNGTIAPKDEKLAPFEKNKNVNFIITEYGKLSRNLENLHSQLNKFDINFSSTPADNWVDCSSIRHHKRSAAKLTEVFKQCCVKYLYTLLNGKLYRCPFIANAANLNAIPDNPSDYVDLFSKNEIKKQIKRLVKIAKFFPGCDFCDGRPYDPSSKLGYDGKGVIKAGIQTPKPLSFKTYN
jgi:uncharacterized Fe-S cluster-containing radical SAM superfamily protein